jgi:hypothetical protein
MQGGDMKSRLWYFIIAFVALQVTALGQQPPVNSPLLEHLAGDWVLRGTVAGKPTTHDVHAEWVLDHHYLQVHEISREKTSSGKPQYEAMVYIAWNEKPKQHYSCAWLDVYGGLAQESIGLAVLKENELPFVFKDEGGETNFTNDFLYDPKTDSWEWRMDNVEKGASKPFARVKLTRK